MEAEHLTAVFCSYKTEKISTIEINLMEKSHTSLGEDEGGGAGALLFLSTISVEKEDDPG